VKREEIEKAAKLLEGEVYAEQIADFAIQKVNAALEEAAKVCRTPTHEDVCNSVCHEFAAADIRALKIPIPEGQGK
jgi:hypothetical protein